LIGWGSSRKSLGGIGGMKLEMRWKIGGRKFGGKRDVEKRREVWNFLIERRVRFRLRAWLLEKVSI
jgi:hypothetical protein